MSGLRGWGLPSRQRVRSLWHPTAESKWEIGLSSFELIKTLFTYMTLKVLIFPFNLVTADSVISFLLGIQVTCCLLKWRDHIQPALGQSHRSEQWSPTGL